MSHGELKWIAGCALGLWVGACGLARAEGRDPDRSVFARSAFEPATSGRAAPRPASFARSEYEPATSSRARPALLPPSWAQSQFQLGDQALSARRAPNRWR